MQLRSTHSLRNPLWAPGALGGAADSLILPPSLRVAAQQSRYSNRDAQDAVTIWTRMYCDGAVVSHRFFFFWRRWPAGRDRKSHGCESTEIMGFEWNRARERGAGVSGGLRFWLHFRLR